MANTHGLDLTSLSQQIEALPDEQQFNFHMDGLIKQYESLKTFSSSDLAEYQRLFDEFEASYSSTETQKGKALEKLVKYIFIKSKLFKVYTNIHTSTNEIDELIVLSDLGKLYSANNLIDFKGKYLLGECKNYQGKIKVTWIGKFCSLIEHQADCRIGILFSQDGFAGRGKWDSAKGLARKFFYRKENLNEKLYVLDFNKKDLKKLTHNVSFLDIIDRKIMDLESDTDIEQHLSKHPAEA